MKKTIAHFGTFDVENYGDLLFPLVAQKRLPDFHHEHLSPFGGGPVWDDCVESRRLEELLDQPISGVLVGGGNILHPNPSSLALYQEKGVHVHGYADLWIGAALSASPDVPVVWNAPGVPRQIKPEFQDLVRAAVERTNYLSVRDEVSRSIVHKVSPHADIAVVPDSAWDLPTLWSADELDAEFANVVGGGENRVVPHVAIHVNDRYARDVTDTELAGVIDQLSAALDARPILVGIGPCHDDDAYTVRIAEEMKTPSVVVARPESLKQVCAAISRSVFYCGSSMHGYVTAASFGVPAIVVAKKTLKFEGLTRFAGAPNTLVASWNDVMTTFSSLDRAALSEGFVSAQSTATRQLDSHWAEIVGHLRSGHGTLEKARFDAYRADFLGATQRVNARRASPLSKLARGLRDWSRKMRG